MLSVARRFACESTGAVEAPLPTRDKSSAIPILVKSTTSIPHRHSSISFVMLSLARRFASESAGAVEAPFSSDPSPQPHHLRNSNRKLTLTNMTFILSAAGRFACKSIREVEGPVVSRTAPTALPSRTQVLLRVSIPPRLMSPSLNICYASAAHACCRHLRLGFFPARP
jgi:hypothetical protein